MPGLAACPCFSSVLVENWRESGDLPSRLSKMCVPFVSVHESKLVLPFRSDNPTRSYAVSIAPLPAPSCCIAVVTMQEGASVPWLAIIMVQSSEDTVQDLRPQQMLKCMVERRRATRPCNDSQALACLQVCEILLEQLASCTDYHLRARFRNAVGWSQDRAERPDG